MVDLGIDLETRSALDLRKTGVHRYAQHETTGIWCASLKFGDEPSFPWLPGEPCPERVVDHVKSGGTIRAFNAAFERVMWRAKLGPAHGWPVPALEQYNCTMVRALAMALPGSLEEGARAIGLDLEKDMQGHALMMRMARPRRIEKDGTVVFWDDQERLDRLVQYCLTDTDVEYEYSQKLFQLSQFEQEVWRVDQVVNDRGVRIDVEAVENAISIIEQEKEALHERMAQATGGKVLSCSNVGALKQWLADKGVQTDSLSKDKIAKLLEKDLPADVLRALSLRQQAGKSSTAKLAAMLNRAEDSGRAQGLFQYSAASTRRWGGRGVQPQNMPRPGGEFGDAEVVDKAIDAMKWRCPELVTMLYGPPQSVVSNCLRGFLCAGEGNTLVAADFESVEGVGLAWLAGEKSTLQAFTDYFNGSGQKLYNIEAAKIFGCKPEEVSKGVKYNVGKAAFLGLGYEGGVGAFSTLGVVYGLDVQTLVDVYPTVLESSPAASIESANAMYLRNRSMTDMPKEAWLACDLIKRNWRDSRPATVRFWADLKDASFAAVQDPGSIHRVGGLIYRMAGQFLWCKLPSGGVLAYPYPKIQRVKTSWKDDNGKPVYRPAVTCCWVDSVTKKWGRRALYGGLLAENVTQAVCRDLLAESLLRAEANGWPIVLHVHDELVAELPIKEFERKGGLPAFETLVAERPSWAPDLPLAAAGWAGKRYRKD